MKLIKKKLQIITITLVLIMNTHLSPIHGQETQLSPDEIKAETAIVMDAETGDIYFDKKMNRQMYPASITKLMTALLVLENTSMTDQVLFSETAVKSLEYGSSSIGIRVNEILTVDQAIHGLLLMSANETANALAEQVSGSVDGFVLAMNTKAQDLGLTNTHFTNPHGLFSKTHYTSAYDIALITQEVIKRPEFMAIMETSMYEIPPTNQCDETRYLAQQHKMLNDKNDMRIYREDVIAGKVGYTSESGHTLVTVADNGTRRLIIAVFNSDNKSRYEDTSKLIEYGYRADPLPLPQVSDQENESSENLDRDTQGQTHTDEDAKNSLSGGSTVSATITVSNKPESLTEDSISNDLSTEGQDNQTFFNRMLDIPKHFMGALVIVFIIGLASFFIIKDTSRRRRLKRKRDRFHDLKL